MKKLHSEIIKKIIISIIAIVMLCNFMMPKISLAASTENGGSFMKPFAKLLCFIADGANDLMQHMFVTEDNIKIKSGDLANGDDVLEILDSDIVGFIIGIVPTAISRSTVSDMFRDWIESGKWSEALGIVEENRYDEYKMLYSPGIIFSGTVPALDIDFIGADGLDNLTDDSQEYFVVHYDNSLWITDQDDNVIEKIAFKDVKNYYEDTQDALVKLAQNGRLIKNDGSIVTIYGSNNTASDREYDQRDKMSLKDIVNGFGIDYDDNSTWEISQSTEAIYQSLEDKTFGDINEDAQFSFNEEEGRILKLNLYDVYVNNNKRDIEIEFLYRVKTIDISDENGTYIKSIKLKMFSGQGLNNRKAKTDDEKQYRSSAAVLQPLVARWYKAFRRIALVGLLSALVYIGIRIVLSSTSAQDKAKYKKMLKDWFMALCLLFMLHYIMYLTVTVVGQVNSIISKSIVGIDGEDVMLTSLRNKIAAGGDWNNVITEIIIYVVITVFTVIYTIQYVRRTIYLAFLTMIAPLITLTYPLDKIKDSKAQAFDTWIKDYVFFTLIQVVHSLLYFILVAQSLDMADKGNWLYAIVSIGFLTQAEKLMKKMFGFEKSKTMGALAAGATGALVMNAINKMQQLSARGGKPKAQGGQAKTSNKSSGKVRTATTNPLIGLQMANDMEQGGSLIPDLTPPEGQAPDDTEQEEIPQEEVPQEELAEQRGEPERRSTGGQSRGGTTGGGQTSGETDDEPTQNEEGGNSNNEEQQNERNNNYNGPRIRITQTRPDAQNRDLAGERGQENTSEIRQLVESIVWPDDRQNNTNYTTLGNIGSRRNTRTEKLNIIGVAKGAGAVYKRYGRPAIRKIGGAFLGAAGATIGFAAGVSQGEVGKALTGAAAGAAAGYYGGQKLANNAGKVLHTATHLNEPINEAVDTYNRGARGEEYVQNARADREFFKSDAYSKLKEENPRVAKQEFQKMLDAGITDAKQMDKILKKVKKEPQKYNLDKAIAYTALAQKCPEKIMYDDKKFIKYLADRKINISQNQVKQLRRGIVDFK